VGGRPTGFYYAPDPSSQQACTIGGNIRQQLRRAAHAEVRRHDQSRLGLEVVMPDGEIVWLGGKRRARRCGYDLAGVFVGSEARSASPPRSSVRSSRSRRR
jgi:glycolate oxidase